MSSPDTFLQHIGIRVVERDEQRAVVEVDLREDLRNRAGMLQGGITATLVDIAGGVLAAAVSGTPRLVTADLSMHYLAPARVGPVRAVATLLRAGRRSVVAQVEVTDTGEDDLRVAFGTITLTILGRSSPA